MARFLPRKNVFVSLFVSAAVFLADLQVSGKEQTEAAGVTQTGESLVQWLQLVHRNQFVLLKALRNQGWYFAIFITPDESIAFCHHNTSGPLAIDFERASLRVEDMAGRDMLAPNAEIKTLTRQLQFARDGRHGKALMHVGCLYPIKGSPPPSLRVLYTVKEAGKNAISLVDEIVYVPQGWGERVSGTVLLRKRPDGQLRHAHCA